jgi:hypothetical protein
MIYILDDSLPNWAETLQALSALIGIPLTIYTLYKLVKRDKDREAEIANLASIAKQLNNMLDGNHNRYKASKRPYITIESNALRHPDKLILTFINSNHNSSLIGYSLNESELTDVDIMTTVINSNGPKQTFQIDISFKARFSNYLGLQVDYKTEEGFIFIQDISVITQPTYFEIVPSPIIALENSAIE